MMSGRCTVLSGGIGGAKLVLGLSKVTAGEDLTVIANTGDDFEHLGLAISPDLDTLVYTLAGEVNTETGWGRRDESWQFMAALEALGGTTWFRLGDRDLATHIERTRRLATGQCLTDVTSTLCERFGVGARILPMTDQAVRTRVRTETGTLDFQHYFVRERAEPRITGLEYAGAVAAEPTGAVLEALMDKNLAAVVIAPSNPYLSIDPMLAIPGLHDAVRNATAPVLAVSPIVSGAAIKGPTAKIMGELGLEVSALSIARHYRELLDGFILDTADRDMAGQIENMGLKVAVCDTIMKGTEDKIRLAKATLDFGQSLK
jgi:LPPG:FO 2-phospho-L-lactate transferase